VRGVARCRLVDRDSRSQARFARISALWARFAEHKSGSGELD
jgi:hypothetical protein